VLLPVLFALVCPFTPNPRVGFYQWESAAGESAPGGGGEATRILDRAVEQMHQVRAGLVRIYLGPRYDYNFPVLSPRRFRGTPVEMLEQEQARSVMEDPCAPTVVLTVYPAIDYGEGLDEIHLSRPWGAAEEKAEYEQVRALAELVLSRYGGSEKTVIVSNSEADSRLEEIADYTGSREIAIRNLTERQRTRYRAISEARAAHPEAKLRLLSAFEISLVNARIREGKGGDFVRGPGAKNADGGFNALHDIVPHVPFDVLSYSAYETTNSPYETANPDTAAKDVTARLVRDLSLLKQAAGKPIMIGELGFARDLFDGLPTGGAEDRLRAALAAIEQAQPAYVVFWQAFDGPDQGAGYYKFGLLEPDTGMQAVLQPFISAYKGPVAGPEAGLKE
jgi:hypothetical protein